MAFYCVTYDLVKQKDYPKLIDELKRLGAERIALSVWLVARDGTSAFSLRDYLKGFVDSDDKLVVIEFSKKPAFTMGFTTGADWIAAHFP